MEDMYKEVYFEQYCKTCEFSDAKETDEPCCDCLNEPVNLYSHKPVSWKKNEEVTRK